jgi:nitrate/TMAO reductase-like tetraheme cytochrome c subunit
VSSEGTTLNLPTPETLLYALLVITAILIAVFVVRPAITASGAGKMLAFVAFCVLPILCGSMAASTHIERSKQTKFCLSCHIMEPYGKSLYVDDPAYIPAAHFQNHRVPPDEACYTCHTNYGLYGGVRAKIGGLRHIYIQYFGTPPAPENIKLYTPYNNRECLHCHSGARSFETNPVHTAMMDQLKSNEMSCITSGCHDTIHNLKDQAKVKFWTLGQ